MENKVEAMLRSWAGNLKNSAYKRRVLEAADEIKRLTERLKAEEAKRQQCANS